MTGPNFFGEQDIFALHEILLKLNNGPSGHQYHLVCSLAGYPQQKFAYAEKRPSTQALAAYYGYSAAKLHHPFADGNKRLAYGLIVLFLQDHGYELDIDADTAAKFIEDVAAGARSEEELIQWVTDHSRSLRFRPVTLLMARLGLDFIFRWRTRRWRK